MEEVRIHVGVREENHELDRQRLSEASPGCFNAAQGIDDQVHVAK